MNIHWALALLLMPLAATAATSEGAEYGRVVALKPDAARGAQLFTQCVACHGVEGGGRINGEIPRIAGQHYRVLVRQIVDFRRGNRWDMRMEGVATSHDVIPELQDVADVAAYVSGLERDGERGVGDGQNLDRGAALYAAKCASCHGKEAQGDDARQNPRLAGQHVAYLTRQMYDAVDGRRPPLTRSHQQLLKPLDFAEVQGLADYLSRMGWQGSLPQP
jgi:cytochrome c553